MDKRTVSSAHTRIDGLEKEIVAIKILRTNLEVMRVSV